MKKFKIAQASSDHESFMKRCGFRHKPDRTWVPVGFASGMIPEEGKEFFVYVQEPSNRSDNGFRYNREDWSGYDGFFTLVRMDDGKETLVDTGYVTSHSTEDYTFYGKGVKIPSGTWSFHCKKED